MTTQIKVTYTATDGHTKTKTYKTQKAAHKFAAHWIGEHPEMAPDYAVSGDGVGKITVEGLTIEELFAAPTVAKASKPKREFVIITNSAGTKKKAIRPLPGSAGARVFDVADAIHSTMKRAPKIKELTAALPDMPGKSVATFLRRWQILEGVESGGRATDEGLVELGKALPDLFAGAGKAAEGRILEREAAAALAAVEKAAAKEAPAETDGDAE